MDFIISENVELLWEIIMEEDIVKVIPRNRINEFRQFYIGQVKQYYEQVVSRNSNIPLVNLNQEFIRNFIQKIQPAPQPPQHTPTKPRELYTAEEIQTDKRNQFDSELTRKQNEFKNAMTVPIPETPKFGDQLDKPIGSAMDELIAKTLAERNYDMQMIQKHNETAAVGNVEQFLKSRETSVKAAKPGYNKVSSEQQNQIRYIKIGDEINDNAIKSTSVIDLSSPKSERLDKKNVSWGNNEYQEYTQQNAETVEESRNTLFSKLKYVAPTPSKEVEELKSEINHLKTQIEVLNEKFDKLMSKFV